MPRRLSIWPILLLCPALILFVVFTVYPLVVSVHYSFYDWNGSSPTMQYVGFDNFRRLVKDPLFWNAGLHTVIYTCVLVGVQTILALVLAVLLNSQYVVGSQVLRAVYFLPIATPAAVTASVISMLIVTGGMEIGAALVRLRILDRPVDWLGNPQTALAIVTSVGIWLGFGYPLIYFLAALKTMDQETLDAAKVDGASAGVLLWRITLPQLRSVFIIVVLMTTLHSVRTFDTVQVMTRGGPYFATDLLGTYTFRQAFPNPEDEFSDSQIGLASAAALLASFLVLGLAGLQTLFSLAVRNVKGRGP